MSGTHSTKHHGYDSHYSLLGNDRNRFHNHYGSSYMSLERNQVNEVGSTYKGLGKDVDDKPRTWRCEDQAVAGSEFKKWNDETAEKISNIKDSSDVYRDMLLQDSGVASRFYKMSSDTIRSRHELENAKRSLENLRAMKDRLLN
ncbi:hypothetical protein ACOME3_006100 [Neoechinorhynchus agilis]